MKSRRIAKEKNYLDLFDQSLPNLSDFREVFRPSFEPRMIRVLPPHLAGCRELHLAGCRELHPAGCSEQHPAGCCSYIRPDVGCYIRLDVGCYIRPDVMSNIRPDVALTSGRMCSYIRPDFESKALGSNIRPDITQIRPDMDHIRPDIIHIRPDLNHSNTFQKRAIRLPFLTHSFYKY